MTSALDREAALPETCATCPESPSVRATVARLALRAIEAREEERTRIARDLHDEAGQALTLVLVRLRLLEDAVEDGPRRADVRELRGFVAEALDGIRRIAADLGPAVLESFGLAAALESLAERVRAETGLSLELRLLAHVAELDHGSAVTLYRVAQEAITNAVRHSRAGAIAVSLEPAGEELRLTVRDDGTGFDADRALRAPRGTGLLGMEERLRVVGGGLTVRSGPEGTTIVGQVPRR